jgi:hypothetical protein
MVSLDTIDVVAGGRPHDHQGIGHREGAVLLPGQRGHVAVRDVLRAREARIPRHPQRDQAVGGVELAVAVAAGCEIAVGEGAQHPARVRDPRIRAQQELGAVEQAVVVAGELVGFGRESTTCIADPIKIGDEYAIG